MHSLVLDKDKWEYPGRDSLRRLPVKTSPNQKVSSQNPNPNRNPDPNTN